MAVKYSYEFKKYLITVLESKYIYYLPLFLTLKMVYKVENYCFYILYLLL